MKCVHSNLKRMAFQFKLTLQVEWIIARRRYFAKQLVSHRMFKVLLPLRILRRQYQAA